MTGTGGARHKVAEAIRSLELAGYLFNDALSAAESTPVRLRKIAERIGAPPDVLLGEERQLRQVVGEIRVRISTVLRGEIDDLKQLLWAAPLPDGPRRGGHLRDFATPGEPTLPPSVRYEPTPLHLPTVPIDIDIARQGQIGNCYLICAINAVAHGDPSALATMVAADPEDATHVIVRVGGGTYRLRATLPVDDWTGQEVYSTSPDGSTLVAYIEKAAAAHLGSWSDLTRGDPAFALTWLMRTRFARIDSHLVSAMSDRDLVDHALAFGACTVIAIPRQASGSLGSASLKRLGARGGHGYTLRRYTTRGLVQLHDPYLDHHPRPMSFHDLRTMGARVAWCSDPRHPT